MASKVQFSQLIPAALAPTWAAISKLEAVADWHPNVARVSVLGDRGAGVGAARRVEFHDGNSVVETITEEVEHQFTTMAMTEMPMMKHAVVTISTEARSADTTEVTFCIEYQVGLGPIGWLLDRLMMRRLFAKVFRMALGGLAYHLETGEVVTNTVPLRAA